MTPRQLLLRFADATQYSAGHFLVADCNRAAWRWITGTGQWMDHALALHGPAGAGKTHLAHVWAARREAGIIAADMIDRDSATAPPVRDLVIEDVDRGVDEDALFHLFNQTRDSGRRLLLTARTPPALWPVALADLRSRITAIAAVEIGEPGDDLLAPLFVKLAADRQLALPPEVVNFLKPRIGRSFEAVSHMVTQLDQMALRRGRRITLPLARDAVTAPPGPG